MAQPSLGTRPNQESEILRIRRVGGYIREGIDFDHVKTTSEMVQQFRNALVRAERELDLDRGLAEQPVTVPRKPGVIGWLRGLF